MNTLTLYFDGACAPVNPGGIATGGWVLLVDGKRTTDGHKVFARGPEATNNLAEWSALKCGLLHLQSVPTVTTGRTLTIHGDSELVIKQITKKYKCNAPHLRLILTECLDVLAKLPCQSWNAEWIPREENTICDGLSRLAYEQETGENFPDRF